MESPFARRRAELARRIGPHAVALVHGTRAARRNHDVEHKYRAPSDVLYLTGLGEPETFLVLAPGREKPFTMFLRARDPEQETWTGRRLGVEGATTRLGADQSFPIEQLGDRLAELLDGATEVHYAPGDLEEVDRLVARTIAQLRAGERRGRRAPTRIVDLKETLHELRLGKDEAQLVDLRRAATITAEAHALVMRAARPGVHEHEIEALIDYTFRRRGGVGPGYPSIVGGGANATILHYTENADVLGEGQLLLVDAGCEVAGTTADVTRTFPIGGRFSEPQRLIYELVLSVEKACIDMVRPGETIESIHTRAVELLADGMLALGLLAADAGDRAKVIESGAYKRFYMHRTSHWLGLDVHDAGYYFRGGEPRRLEPGMVLTVEPGLYVGEREAGAAGGRYRDIGVRIEDDVLVTEAGHEVLTAAAPKEVEAIEALTTGPRFAFD